MYKLNIVDNVIISKESYFHLPNYEPQVGEIFTDIDVPVPSTPIYDESNKIIDGIEIPIIIEEEPTILSLKELQDQVISQAEAIVGLYEMIGGVE